MLIQLKGLTPFDFHGLTIRDFGAVGEGALLIAVIDVPAGGEHPAAYSARCDKTYYVLEGTARFGVDGVLYEAQAGDVVSVPHRQVFWYDALEERPVRLLLVHVPAFCPEAEHVLPNLLCEHGVHLRGDRVTLRPMTEQDWPHVLAWNADPEVLIWSDGLTEVRPEEDTKDIYRTVSLSAHVFLIELEGEPIGECWLQKMNLPSYLERFPGQDVRRIDLVIGRKDLWGQGLGSDTIRTLVRFGFEQEDADVIFGLVEAGNPRSRAAFRKAGFACLGPQMEGEARPLVLRREPRPGKVLGQ